jgi:16S rRNA (guanine527-N7)-methyltransferase
LSIPTSPPSRESQPRAREWNPIGTSSSNQLDAWLAAVVDERGLTALDLRSARERLLDDSLRATAICAAAEGVVIDVGSGNGAPGIPLAVELPSREVVLLDASQRRCAFLERWRPANARVVCGRVEEQPLDWAGVSVAKALAPPPVAAEWCLPLVRPGGISILWVGASIDKERVGRVAARLNAEIESSAAGLLVLRKLAPTPTGFPRRVGVARRRPLG